MCTQQANSQHLGLEDVLWQELEIHRPNVEEDPAIKTLMPLRPRHPVSLSTSHTERSHAHKGIYLDSSKERERYAPASCSRNGAPRTSCKVTPNPTPSKMSRRLAACRERQCLDYRCLCAPDMHLGPGAPNLPEYACHASKVKGARKVLFPGLICTSTTQSDAFTLSITSSTGGAMSSTFIFMETAALKATNEARHRWLTSSQTAIYATIMATPSLNSRSR